MLDELKSDLYSVLDRVKLRARLADRILDAYDIERVEALMSDVKLKDEMRAFKSPVDGHIIMKTFKSILCSLK